MEELDDVARGVAAGSPTGVVVSWAALGPEVAAKLQPAVGTLVEDVLAAVAHGDVPHGWLAGSPNTRHGVERGLRDLLRVVETGPHAQLPGRDVYFGFGRVQRRAGRPLGPLLAAYHHAARAAWRAIVVAGARSGLGGEATGAISDAILACLGEISSATAEGFAFEQALLKADLPERRRLLVAALLRPRPASGGVGGRGNLAAPGSAPGGGAASSGLAAPRELQALADAAGWRLAPTVAVVACAEHELLGWLTARLPPDALAATIEGAAFAIVPDPDAPGRQAELRARLEGANVALGPTVALAAAAESARWARLALSLARGGGGGFVVATEHRTDLLLLDAPAVAAGLAEEALAPLAGLTPGARERLQETLAAWLRHQGVTAAAAAELHVHPQTVRYRVGQLRALLGAQMDDAEGRLELELALRARGLNVTSS